MKKYLIGAAAGALMFASLASPAFAAKPAQPNCLGTDVSGFSKTFKPLGQNVVTNFISGGFGTEVLGHLQGASPLSSCPAGGFPTPTP